MTRDELRTIKLQAKQLDCIKSDRFRSADPRAELTPASQWEKSQKKFVDAKNRIISLVMSSRDVKDERMKTAHSLQQSMGDFKNLERFSAQSVRADYRKLSRHITRYMIKVEKNGGIMKPAKLKFESKYRNLLAEANDFIKEVKKF